MKNTLETRLGLFFALALVAGVVLLEMIGTPDFFKSGYVVKANFNTIQELKVGDPIKMAGVEIGRVRIAPGDIIFGDIVFRAPPRQKR